MGMKGDWARTVGERVKVYIGESDFPVEGEVITWDAIGIGIIEDHVSGSRFYPWTSVMGVKF